MSEQKRVFIIHCWGDAPDCNWYPWLKERLEEKGLLVSVPEMPDTDNPKIETWTDHLRKVVGNCDENTFFVGHSIGCQTIMRYWEKLSENEKCGGAVFVAGWITLTGIDDWEERIITSPWINSPIDFGKVKTEADRITCIFSDNDPFVPAENWEIFSEKLGAEVILLKNKGHFTTKDEVVELPEALEAVLNITGAHLC